jgi:hypothetical protein
VHGGYARGIARRGNANAERVYAAIIELARLGWGTDNPAFRQVFNRGSSPAERTGRSAGSTRCAARRSPDVAAQPLEARAQTEVEDLLPRVRTRTSWASGRGPRRSCSRATAATGAEAERALRARRAFAASLRARHLVAR